jgi:hypothetical protein
LPVTLTSAEIAGQEAASYPVPALVPHGSVRIVSFGMTDVRPQNLPHTRAQAMRLVVSNESQESWSVDARVQALVFDDGQAATPEYALAIGGAPPIVVVPAGTTRAIDLFFPLPDSAQTPSTLPRFDAVWSVRTPGHVVTGRTPFARSPVRPRAYANVEPLLWMDPLDPTISLVTLVHLEGPHLHRLSTEP